MIYAGADKAIKQMNRRNLRTFSGLALAPTDELNITRSVMYVYDDAFRATKKRYLEIAIEAYAAALMESGVPRASALKRARYAITTEWVLDLLEDYDAVTAYKFTDEWERKRQYLTETLIMSATKAADIEKNLKYLARQIGQYAITVVDAARMTAFRDSGVEKVMWNTERDNRVCPVCEALDGQIFPKDSAPGKQHYNCRCYYTPVRDTFVRPSGQQTDSPAFSR